jgi:hypothetical protein
MGERRPRAADDFVTIRARMEELKRERPRAADDYAAIRARMEELKREREAQAERAKRPVGDEPKDERLRRISDEFKGKVVPRRNWPPV